MDRSTDYTGWVMNGWFLKVFEGYMAAITLFTKIYVWEYLFIDCNSKKWEQHKSSSIGNYLNKLYSWMKLNAAVKKNAAAKLLQSCPTLCDPIDGSPPGSPVPWILQARTLEWVAISFSNAWKWKVKVKSLSRVRLFATPWTAAYQAPLSMGMR